jgi:hypothetical protein
MRSSFGYAVQTEHSRAGRDHRGEWGYKFNELKFQRTASHSRLVHDVKEYTHALYMHTYTDHMTTGSEDGPCIHSSV